MGGWEGVAFLAVGVVHGWLVVDVCGWGFHVFGDICVGLCGFVAGATFGHGNLCEHAVIAIRQKQIAPHPPWTLSPRTATYILL